MSDSAPIEIKLSKGKLIKMMIGCIIFIALGGWMVFDTPPDDPAIVVQIAGWASILFFGACLIFGIKKMADQRPGLIIDNAGIVDNSSGISGGFIPWSDIAEIRMLKTFNQKFLMLILNNPEEYINKQTSALKRKTIEINYKSYGSPVSISANALQCNFEELKNILDKKLSEYKTKK
jgi:hypothetical protein